jgi:ATP adenylyltransferase
MERDRLYTPWRLKYITSNQKLEGCVFCAALQDDSVRDRDNYLLFRGRTTFTMMNIYPYNPGHLMILPQQHVSTLTETSPETQVELITLTSYFIEILSQVTRPDGFNVGLNIGRAAGAGIDSHLHMHIVPRWNGDSNFMPVVGNTRVLPETLDDTYDRILTALRARPPGLP